MVKIAVLNSTATTTVTVAPAQATFYFRGNGVEVSSRANGATVQPSVAPSNWLGTFVVRGSGYAAFDNVTDSSGIAFHNGGEQNVNTAFINFSGQTTGQVFKTQGEVSFALKSAYTFAQRQALPSLNIRYAFEVYDDTRSQFAFYTYTSNGALVFAYMANGVTSAYQVPAGHEDAIFGAGVIAHVRVAWSSTSVTLYVNDQPVQANPIMPLPSNWTGLSALTIGAHSSRVLTGGHYSCDDAIAEFEVR